MSTQTYPKPTVSVRDGGAAQGLTEQLLRNYQRGRLARREALRRIAGIVGSLLIAENLLAGCVPLPAAAPAADQATPLAATAEPTNPPAEATAATVAPSDPAITEGPVEYPGQGATILAYLARPAGAGPSPGVLVCHENRGLTEHIMDVARRLAKEGYVALAVDLLSREGGMDKITDPAGIPGLLSSIPPEQLVQDFRDGLRYLQEKPEVRRDRIGMTGFCFGGGVTWRCATQIPELGAAVPFYGPNPPLEDVPKIHAPVLGIYGEDDQRINSGIPALEEAMKQHGKVFEKKIYPNAGHAFFNDTGTRYNPEAASDAWARMLAWFGKYLC